jgi:hypothetical protein
MNLWLSAIPVYLEFDESALINISLPVSASLSFMDRSSGAVSIQSLFCLVLPSVSLPENLPILVRNCALKLVVNNVLDRWTVPVLVYNVGDGNRILLESPVRLRVTHQPLYWFFAVTWVVSLETDALSPVQVRH